MAGDGAECGAAKAMQLYRSWARACCHRAEERGVSGAGADSSEKGRVMWARVKGQIENALLALPFKGVYVFAKRAAEGPAIVRPHYTQRFRYQ